MIFFLGALRVKFIKLTACSTQLSMKFQSLINLKCQKNKGVLFWLKLSFEYLFSFVINAKCQS